jgi:hypothetical protein
MEAQAEQLLLLQDEFHSEILRHCIILINSPFQRVSFNTQNVNFKLELYIMSFNV